MALLVITIEPNKLSGTGQAERKFTKKPTHPTQKPKGIDATLVNSTTLWSNQNAPAGILAPLTKTLAINLDKGGDVEYRARVLIDLLNRLLTAALRLLAPEIALVASAKGSLNIVGAEWVAKRWNWNSFL